MPANWLSITHYPSPLGPLAVVTGPAGLCRLAFPGEKPDAPPSYLAQKFPGATINVDENGSSCREVLRQLDEYFAGRRFSFSLPLDLRGTPFQLAVWSALQRIPYGTTCSYSDIALVTGRPGAVRAVGQAIGRNPVGIIIPCHRVIGKDGRLVGFGSGLATKEWLLNFEESNLKTNQTLTGR
ncbi:Methylated-DNA--protein-cysteine methyltransferase [Neomoorella glycerini]|uniref:Methylated-DNA--protein-cysteine methyltransferase n=1 Tax=Neomoorella glycerini TaxID=55779 RepID=A0A6I5ZV33_9FIRM|nr:methylated-DNA--[protein]-cysteine S-methyltransferase [Moorella glycerini]QGP93734.1 Methylated-DNA--protein-cysteine methyltransferase [Moorella glycerini]